jgi:hypothetical protein
LPVNLVSGAPGVFTIIQYADDTSVGVNFGNNQFNFYGTTYSGSNSLFVSSNGLISFGSPNSAFGNQDLTTNPQQATIAPLWDDWVKTSGSPMVLGEFDTANNQLIVQWNQVQHFLSNSPVTFQAVLQLNTGNTPGNIIFNYPSIETSDRYSNGEDATVGIKDNGTQGPNRVLVSFNGTNPLVESNQAILFSWDLPAPVISSLTPDSVAEGTAGLNLTVNGSNFAQNAVVQANGSAIPTTFVSGTQLQATLPASAFAEEGSFAVDVVNPTSGRTSSTLTLTVLDAPLTATGQTLSGTEGQGLTNVLVATFTDPGTDGTTADYVANVTWDDGGSLHDSPGTVQWAGGDLFNVYASNTVPYARPGVHAVSVTVADLGGSRAAASGTVNVVDASLTASGLTLSATEGAALTGAVATFTDANPNSAADDFTATITWGDGHVSAGTVTANPAGGFNVTGTNTYLAAGNYSVGVVVQDFGGASANASTSAAVADAALTGTGALLSGIEGSPFNGIVATFADADPNGGAGNYSATITWGDGHVSTGTVTANPAGGFNVTGTNTYVAAGNYSVGVAIRDVGGASTNANGSAAVADATLAGTGTALSAVEGSVFNGIVASFTDADPNAVAGNYSATIAWGDGHVSTGTVTANASGGFDVTGTNTYTAAGSYSVGVAIHDVGGALVNATSGVTVADAVLTATGSTLSAVEGSPFNGVVASFTDADPNAVAGNYSATITWGDGRVSAGSVTANATGGFDVTATNIYTAAGTYSVGVVVRDVGGASTNATSGVIVADAVLTATGGLLSAVEGSPFSGAVASFTDADPNAVAGNYSATITWGDGHVSAGTVTANATGGFDVAGTNSYVTAGSYSVGVDVHDVGGASANVNSSAVVADAALTGTGAALSAVEGSPFNGVVASFTDADPNAVAGNYSATITWGDGHVSTGTVTANSAGGFNVAGTNAYATAGSYSVGVVVQDDGGASANASSSAVVGDAALTGTGTALSAVEGSLFSGVLASFTDADPNAVAGNYSATITWGDGHVSAGTVTANATGGFNVTGSNTYAASGSYSVGVAVQDVGGASTNVNSSAVVTDAALTGTGAALSTVEGSLFNGVVASFTDADPNAVVSSYSATITWGDGHVSAGKVTANAAGGFNVSGTNTYVAARSYSVGVVVQDVGGASTAASSRAVVADATLTETPAVLSVAEGSRFSGVVASFTDADPNAVAGNYSATITWGDGHVSPGTVTGDSAGGFDVTGTNTYAAAGSYSVGVAVQDVGGASANATSSAQVADAPLSATGVALTGVEGNTFIGVVASFTDADPNAVAGNYSATITWGDGHVSSGTVTANPAGGFNVTGTNAYARAGNYSIGVAIQDSGGVSANVSSTAQITDAPLAGTGAALVAVEGNAFSGVVASFTDADPDATADSYSATINWGDGASSPGAVSLNAKGGFDISGQHSYTEEGSVVTSVTISDVGGASTSVAGTATVSDAPLTATPVAITATAGFSFSGVLARFSDADATAPLSDYSASIAWGDGSTTVGTIAADGHGGYTVQGGHAYVKVGSFTVQTTIRDKGGCSALVSTQVAIASRAPLTAIGLTVKTTEGVVFSGPVASFVDADSSTNAGDLLATINWGDGSRSTRGSVQLSSGHTFIVVGSHTYADAGSYAITVVGTVAGRMATARSTAKVADSVPFVTAALLAGHGRNEFVVIGAYTDAAYERHTAVIHWGDGRDSVVQLGNGRSGAFKSTHSYQRLPSGRNAVIVVTVQDDELTDSKPVTLPLVFGTGRSQGLPSGLQGLAAGDVLLLKRLVHVVDVLMAGDGSHGKVPATQQGGGAGSSGNSPSTGHTVTTGGSRPKVATLQDQILDFLFSTPGVDSLLAGLNSGLPGS